MRPSVRNISLAVNFDVSLFERLYTRKGETRGMAKVMLHQQYRMHSSICNFASREFYQGRLQSEVRDCDRSLPESSFPWSHSLSKSSGETHTSRIVFLECAGSEDLGHRSKRNQPQAELCVSVCKLLLCQVPSPANPNNRDATREQSSIAVLTPYTRQRELLTKLLKDFDKVEVSSIDGFQGREADIVVFVSVRCNESGEIGFLKDLRRLNVVVTRAKLGLIIIGSRATLTRGSAEEESTGIWKRLLEHATSVAHTEESS